MIGPKVPRQTAADERRARTAVKARDGGVCVRCLRGGPANWDHRLNRSQGGLWLPSHGQLLCGSGTTGCHGWRTTNPAAAVREGWAVPGHTLLAPSEWPARRWLPSPFGTFRLAWVLLNDAGGWVEIDEIEATFRRRKGGLAA